MNQIMKRGGDDQEMEGMFRTPQVLSKSYTSTVLDLYLDSEIGSPDKYREIYHALSNAGHQDYIVLHVNSVGGRMDAGLQIINHIRNCKAKVVGVLHVECASMASAILLACDEWEINDFSTMMIHSCSYGAIGKQSDVHNRVQFTTKFNEKFIRKNYTGFLSEEEIQKVLEGADLYFDSDEITKRLETFSELRDKEDTEEVVEQEVVEEETPAPARSRKPKAKA